MIVIAAGTVALAALLMTPAAGSAQRHGSESIGGPGPGRLDTGVGRLPERPSSDLRHREETLPPESYVPRRSPDLGEPYFPLSPSIGPGSGLLGPEAGREPGRLRSGSEPGSPRNHGR